LETPKDLTALEYARHILEEVLGWPCKGNLEMIADCITSISKSRKISLVKAHGYMVRAIGLASKQGIEIDKWFFQEGKYTSIRPEVKTNQLPEYKPMDREAIEREQSTPEWQDLNRQLREKLAEIAKMPRPDPRRREELQKQAEKLGK
jgi:hypothetical protein